jgi:predicted kinase
MVAGRRDQATGCEGTMSHDKIKAAARERMAETGEPYAAARREAVTRHQAATGHGHDPGSGMLLWINGPCGVGKKTTAAELHRRLPGSVICAPGAVGMAMHRMLPPSARRMWQDIPAWRHSVRELLRMTLAGHDGPVIAPATLVDEGHFQEIIGGLRDDGVQVHHFALPAEPATVVRRLRARSLGLEPRTQPWELDVLDGWLEQLGRPEFAQHVHTDHMTVAQVADVISAAAGLTIAPSTDGPVRAWLHRYATTARHIRWS